jgi:nucleoside-diphosphate-sugar epimerase
MDLTSLLSITTDLPVGETHHLTAAITFTASRDRSMVRSTIWSALRAHGSIMSKDVLVTGGAGYIGSILVPTLLERGEHVTVFDRFFFGYDPLSEVRGHDNLELVQGDIRDDRAVDRVLEGGQAGTDADAFDAVIHLAAISNDPGSKLDAELTKSVNRDAVQYVMTAAKSAGVDRMLYASSASVYGIKEVDNVTEDLELNPITLYARYKAEGEEHLNDLVDENFCGVSVRAATVCGYAPRLRLDLVINILTAHALSRGEITVFGGDQMRPNIHVQDITNFYLHLLDYQDRSAINGEPFNVSYSNSTVMGLAEMIRDELADDINIEVESSDDDRSYHLSADKAKDVLDFVPQHSLSQAVSDLESAWQAGKFDTHDAPIHHNVEWMKQHADEWKYSE